MKNEPSEKLDNLRHSIAHLLAAAVMDMWPDAKRTIGPAIENGFYFDFEFSEPVSDKDLQKIEKRMRKILPSWKGFERHDLDAEEAKAEYPDNEFKHELVEEFTDGGNEKVSFYKSGTYWNLDLCKGGHVEDPSKEINPDAFKLTHVAGAYWRGDEKNKMLTRIYGVAFETKEELDEYLEMQALAKERDHKKLGKELDLFTFSDAVGKGLPLFTPKGSIIRRELERFIVDEETKRGYVHVYTPDIAKIDLYEKSGHYPHYKDSMYAPIEIDDEKFMLRPMTCPHHYELFQRKPHSYRELPMRIAELASLYRYEQSGELSGLQRVRTFCLADAHIICKDEDEAAKEAGGALDLIEYVAGILGLKLDEDYWYRLSLGDRDDDEKYFKNDAAWDKGEALLRKHLQERGCDFVEAEKEAAFYGPKIDVQMKNVNGKEDTAFTVQYDFCMPERFKLNYTAEDGSEKQALVIHRSSIGAIERSMAFFIEHYGGAFPLWLSPVQIKVLPISEKQAAYAQEVFDALRSTDIRVELDDAGESLGKKIRNTKKEKVPYFLVIGDQEMKDKTVTLEGREGQVGVMSVEDLISKLKEEIDSKAI